MVSKYDLYDLSAVLVNIRSDIQYELNSVILSKVIEVLKLNDQTFQDNQVRKAIASIKNLDQERWYFVYHNNVYVNHRILKNKQVYQLLIKACETFKQLLDDEKYEEAYDLVESIHCLPDIIAENNFLITKSYWQTNIEDYRKKWDKTFLKNEEKEYNISQKSHVH